jgi:hypothetical protein
VSAEIVVRTKAGRIHKAFMTDEGVILTAEACNLDQTHTTVIEPIPEDADWQAYCRRCFPPGPDSEAVPNG